MDAQQFLAEFGHIANAPCGVENLRQMVYQLAVTGKLTARGQLREDSAELLASVEAARTRMISEKAYKRMLELESEPVQSPAAIALPESWCWSRLLDLGEINPRNEAPDELLAAFVPMSGVPQLHKAPIASETRRWGEIKKGYTHFAEGDVMLAKITPCFENGKAAVVRRLAGDSGVAAGTTELHVFRPIHEGILPEYVYLFLKSPLFTADGESSMTGTAGQKRLPTEYFATHAFPLPPTEEQVRIAAKVDELMILCDQLEQQQQARRKSQKALRESTLQALAGSESLDALQKNWGRLNSSFDLLFSSPQDTDDLVAGLKGIATRGLLSEASAMDTRIDQIKIDCASLRAHYANIGIMRRQQPAGLADPETSYPKHWSVVALDEIAVVIGGVTKGRDLRDRKTIYCPYLSVANVQRGYFKLDELKSIEIGTDELEKYLVHPGDLLVTEGGDWDKVGRTAIWRGGVKNCLHQNHIFKVRVPSPLVLEEWVELVFNSHIGRDYFAGASKQTTNLASINMTQLRSFPFPVPPLDEQKRIIAALAALSLQCMRWREQLERKQLLSGLFAGAVTSTLTGISTEEEKAATMKVPQTELIAPLRLGKPPRAKTEAPLARELARHNGELPARDLWQRVGGEIDAFYAQLKHEVAQGWIQEPGPAEMRVIEA